MSKRKTGSTTRNPDYAVGRNRPPKHTQFKKGVSPNPGGRPKKQPCVHDQVTKLLARKISVPENGVVRTMTVLEAALLAIGQKMLRGDLKAFAFLLNLSVATRDNPSTTIDPAALASFDQATLKRYLRDVVDREAALANDPPSNHGPSQTAPTAEADAQAEAEAEAEAEPDTPSSQS
jgi:hypothetical protein